MILESLNKFFFELKRYIITYKNGFYILPYVGNSPEAMIYSLSRVPYNESDEENNIILTDNPFTKGSCQYQNIEDGLWVLYSDLFIKKNVSYKKLHAPQLPSNYYSLSFRMDKNQESTQLIDGQNYRFNNAILCKPKAKATNFFHKTSKTQSLNLFFSIEWLEKNLHNSANEFYNPIQYFMNSDKESLCIPHFFSETDKLNEEIASIFSKEKGNANKNKLALKIKSLNLVQSFLFKVSSEEQKNINSYTEVLSQYFYQSFPGIEYFSKEFGISPSKLKADFKKETGTSMFQYFRGEQMNLAKKMLADDSVLIKNVSLDLGYENVSKFSAAFKKHHGYLPSKRD